MMLSIQSCLDLGNSMGQVTSSNLAVLEFYALAGVSFEGTLNTIFEKNKQKLFLTTSPIQLLLKI